MKAANSCQIKTEQNHTPNLPPVATAVSHPFDKVNTKTHSAAARNLQDGKDFGKLRSGHFPYLLPKSPLTLYTGNFVPSAVFLSFLAVTVPFVQFFPPKKASTTSPANSLIQQCQKRERQAATRFIDCINQNHLPDARSFTSLHHRK